MSLLFQLLEAVQSVHKAVQSNNRGEEDQLPPVPPYPDVSSLRLDEGKMTHMSSSVHQGRHLAQNDSGCSYLPFFECNPSLLSNLNL